ncbi:hypothetical protein CAPTEDRAFT_204222 [Capitella teleta]|uniref:Uncharacterized protein n=1 Tax=Capitella teleta TaxID=283909 RepID=R7T7M8_CAPTE|nr:hypothetical protein CAPTEDRAFT_204222 [Capitella teleta]|eukprot:ELT87425.1 hypothetical protein CAPTEDRAFT_204222 [Capitella teleta]
MATSNRSFRPEMDWTMDADIPHRFKQWKRQVRNEVRLLMTGDSSKGVGYACTIVLVSAGEQGEDIIDQAGLFGERSDHIVKDEDPTTSGQGNLSAAVPSSSSSNWTSMWERE